MSKKTQILKNNLKKIKFILVASIFFFVVSTIIFNLNYSSITIKSNVQIEVVESNYATRKIIKDNNIDLTLIANTSDLQEIKNNYNLSKIKWNNQSIDFSITRELKSYPTYGSEIFLKEYSKLKEDIALSILKKLNTQLKILTDEIMVNKYMSLYSEKKIVDKIEALEKNSNEDDKIKLMTLKLEFYKFIANSPFEIEKFKNVQNLDEFKKIFNIKYDISRINDETYENKKIISYFDLFILILTLLIIYLSLDLFLNKFKKLT